MLAASPTAKGPTWTEWAAGALKEAAQTDRAPAPAPASTFAPPPAVVPVAGTISASDPLISFVEPEESFLSQSIRNYGMTLATLGFYSFWARADARRQLHRSIRIGGQPLDYTGTGREACISFLIGTLTTVVIVSTFVYFFSKTGATADQARAALSDFRVRRLFISLPLIFLLGSVVYRKRKHLLRRTWWRGQHFDLDGQPWSYAIQHLWTAFLVPLSLGWAAPWRASVLARRKITEMHLGDHRFEAVGGVAALYRAFAALWFGGGLIYVATMMLLGLTVGQHLIAAVTDRTIAPLAQPGVMPTLLTVLVVGLLPVLLFALYYRAAWIEHQISSLVFNGVRLRLTLPKARFAGLMLWNGFIKIVSFGAFQSVADAALARFVIARITSEPWTAPSPK